MSGRIDDVLNVGGHRRGTMEIESALVAHRLVAESAVVSKPHDIKGESVFAYVVLNVPRPEGAAANSLIQELRNWVGEQLSPIAKPDEIRLTDNLPKTRSGKIMRRLLRSIARGEEITQDVTTLEHPGILEERNAGGAAPAAVKRAAAGKKVAAPPKAQKANVTVKRAKPIRRVKQAKRKVAKRKAVVAKSRRAAIKAVRRSSKARGKK